MLAVGLLTASIVVCAPVGGCFCGGAIGIHIAAAEEPSLLDTAAQPTGLAQSPAAPTNEITFHLLDDKYAFLEPLPPPPRSSGAGAPAGDVNPPVLRVPPPTPAPETLPQPTPEPGVLQQPEELLRFPIDPPLGFTGPSSVLPSEDQESSDFVPLEDRWRSGFPDWDRYDKGHPPIDDYPYVKGNILDPFNQNVLKGDYPIIGQHTFLNITAESQTILETRQIPTPQNGFDSTSFPGGSEFFGNPNQFALQQFFRLSFDLFHGDAAFKPVDWRIKLQPVFNMNYLDVQELGVVSPDVTQGRLRFRDYFALEQWFAEVKLADLSPDYDFLSLRLGSQPFTSDFRGFIFDDTNRGVRLFGTRASNQEQFNVVYFDQQEKNTDSDLNTFQDRGQQVLIANYYRQDFIWPGYTTQFSFHYDHDAATIHYDDNGFLVRPDPAGIAQPHQIDACYLGWAGDGHIGALNINHAFYWAFGEDQLNPMSGQPVTIDAEMGALELSYDKDWVRFRSSFFFASGDSNPYDDHGRGFDTILDNPNFAGGDFSYWQRQPIKLLGVNLKQANSLVPDLRAAKSEGQANFVNPGLELVNFGMDFEVTPKLRLVSNANLLWFENTAVLEQFVFQSGIHRFIGTDLSLGMEYRPLLSNNCIVRAGVASLLPGQGFHDIFDPFVGHLGDLVATFVDVTLTY